MMIKNIQKKFKAFTIVELIVVVTVIGILVSITFLAYTGVTSRAKTESLSADLKYNATKLKAYKAEYGSYPTALDANNCPSAPNATTNPSYCLTKSSSNTIASYTGATSAFSVIMSNGSTYYYATESTGSASYTPAPFIQTTTSANCPTTRTRAVDARDNHTYWVQKLADGKCWMLTNLGYAGGGTNTYGDVDTLTNGTGGVATYTVASYYVVPSTTNFTIEPTDPSTSTDGAGQYGYLYNFCGANGGQTGNGACSDTSSTAVNTAASVCPAGWRLPVGNGAEFAALNTAVNSGSTTSDAGIITTPWLGQRSGLSGSVTYDQGVTGLYWSSTQLSATAGYNLRFYSGLVNPAYALGKSYGLAVRCVAV